MRLQGWERKYNEILREFGFNKRDDLQAAKFLNSLLDAKVSLDKLEHMIKGKTVFVIGAGPSLSYCLTQIKKYKNVTKVVADGATKALIEKHIQPHIVVTDLDGNLEYLKKASRSNSMMIVHSHGDNIGTLPVALSFRNCIGTTEGRPFGKIRNFGGFTDGDRCVFLARYFGAKRIIMFGMDFGKKIGFYSKEGRYDKKLKIKKLRTARHLLTWLSSKGGCEFYTTSEHIKGFQKIKFSQLADMITS